MATLLLSCRASPRPTATASAPADASPAAGRLAPADRFDALVAERLRELGTDKPSDEAVRELKARLAAELFDEILLEQAAQQAGLAVSAARVQATTDAVRASFGDRAAFERAVALAGGRAAFAASMRRRTLEDVLIGPVSPEAPGPAIARRGCPSGDPPCLARLGRDLAEEKRAENARVLLERLRAASNAPPLPEQRAGSAPVQASAPQFILQSDPPPPPDRPPGPAAPATEPRAR